MTRQGRACVALVVAAIALAAALAGCAQSANTTSAGAPGSGPPTSATPSTPTTSTTVTAPTSTGTGTSGSGSTSPPAGRSTLTVSPSTGSPQSVIRFSFTSPQAVSSQSSDDISESLSVIGPQKAGCVGVHQEAVPSLAGGQPVSLALGPSQLGGSWCPGTYAARVEVVERPKCSPGMMCPQFIRVLALIGPVSFTISG